MKLAKFFKSPDMRALLLLASTASLALLAAAFVAQYGFQLHPCHLCLLQRYPYAAIAALGLMAAWLPLSPRARFFALALCGALFFIDGAIAVYHAGVELQWFPGPTACSNNGSAGESLEEMRRAIMAAPLVTCDQAMAQLFGLSMAAWNAIAAFSLGAITFFMWRKTSNEK